MEDEEFLQKLMQVFASEAEEHVQAISEGLLELEKAPAPARSQQIIETIFREAHSLKGAGRSVERTDIEAVCQALESVFEDLEAEWRHPAGRDIRRPEWRHRPRHEIDDADFGRSLTWGPEGH